MNKVALFSVVLAVLQVATNALACDAGDLQRNLTWCMSDANKDGYGDIVVGSCKKDAVQLRNGFRSCQHDSGVRDRYDNCSAGEQIDNARSVGSQLHLYTDPAACVSRQNECPLESRPA